ncbi:hypothetical protein GGP41_002180 [Bipolaris sorokiniana]|uniref:Uncharacterized protein n=1 Tax=Cochliobolus sativus TaxID=45130 RepID=A0A8H6DZ15_COCSA|nr:hypothetical protein GGP41_002180 [Bipolaris sorokiniana]
MGLALTRVRSPTAEDIIPVEHIKLVIEYHEALVQAEPCAEWTQAKRALSACKSEFRNIRYERQKIYGCYANVEQRSASEHGVMNVKHLTVMNMTNLGNAMRILIVRSRQYMAVTKTYNLRIGEFIELMSALSGLQKGCLFYAIY